MKIDACQHETQLCFYRIDFVFKFESDRFEMGGMMRMMTAMRFDGTGDLWLAQPRHTSQGGGKDCQRVSMLAGNFN